MLICDWGRRIRRDGDNEPCENQATILVALADGHADMPASIDLCQRHFDIIEGVFKATGLGGFIPPIDNDPETS